MEKLREELGQVEGVSRLDPPGNRDENSGSNNVADPVEKVGLALGSVGVHSEDLAAKQAIDNALLSAVENALAGEWTVTRARSSGDLIRACLSLPMGQRMEWVAHCLVDIAVFEHYSDGGPVADIAAYQVVLSDARQFAAEQGVATSYDDWLAPHLEPLQALEQAQRVCDELRSDERFREIGGALVLTLH